MPGPLDGSAGAEYVLALTGARLITPVSFPSSQTLQHHAESSINSKSALWDSRGIGVLYGCHPFTAMTYQNDLLNLKKIDFHYKSIDFLGFGNTHGVLVDI